ncbi:hypothetical protein NMK71_08005 [Weeksellaceae bacterium KMM 9713]|uniref:Uncharacterized protein n=1 Tax=Profundicola chukchiensis TaxID=2961959 RepID=A0A9X4MYJ2_9FLAO|nr:hypothetical protein [Profundicola chukchiensis]MDG4946354.1 hypothetical protein [Profundicola chukchiensis]MDG4950893.1 hypothetical protein [Profundicola chukchiensis]
MQLFKNILITLLNVALQSGLFYGILYLITGDGETHGDCTIIFSLMSGTFCTLMTVVTGILPLRGINKNDNPSS